MNKLCLVLFMVLFWGETMQPGTKSHLETSESSFPSSKTGTVRILFICSEDCSHCQNILDEVINPLQITLGNQLDLRMMDISQPEYFRYLEYIEEKYRLEPTEHNLPIIIINDQVLSGEKENRSHLHELVRQALASGGSDWPSIPGFDPAKMEANSQPVWTLLPCIDENPDACEAPQPIYAAYFHDTGCQACSGAYLSLSYIQSRYPQLIIQEYDSSDYAAIGEWLSRRSGRGALKIPALFIENQAWIGDKEIQPASIEPVIARYTPNGAEKVWEPLEKRHKLFSLILHLQPSGWIMAGVAGLLDGLSPLILALASLIIYLTFQKPLERQPCATGAAFLASTFLTCLGIQLQLFQISRHINTILVSLSPWAYALGAVGCFVLAVYNLRALRNMHPSLDHDRESPVPPMKTTQKGWKPVLWSTIAFISGALVTFLGFSLQDQISLPSMNFISTLLEQRSSAIALTWLYSLLFILPTTGSMIIGFSWLTAAWRKHGVTLGKTARSSTVLFFLLLTVWLVFAIIV